MRRLAGLLLAALVAVTTVVGFASTAQASTTAVDGGDALTDDWGDHYGELGNSLCNGCGDSNGTDLVFMWQSILYAEGYLSKSGVDGYFGSGTESATKKWQARAGLSADGKVGSGTWGKADDRLRWWRDSAGNYAVRYYAVETDGYVRFYRGDKTYGGGGGYSMFLISNGSDGGLNVDRNFGVEYDIRLFRLAISL